MIPLTLFGALSALAIFSALSVVLSRNPIYSVLSLIVCFFAIAGHYLLLQAQFLAIVHMIVYAGAIMVLFLFVIMLMNLARHDESHAHILFKSAAVGVSGLLMLTLISVVKKSATVSTQTQTVQQLGKTLLGEYAIPFELSAILFLAAVMGIVLIGFPKQDA